MSSRRAAAEAFQQAVRRDVQPDDVPAPVEPVPDRWIRDDTIGRDDRPERPVRPRPLREPEAGHHVGASCGITREVDEPGAQPLREHPANDPGAGPGGPNQHGFHRR